MPFQPSTKFRNIYIYIYIYIYNLDIKITCRVDNAILYKSLTHKLCDFSFINYLKNFNVIFLYNSVKL